MNCELCPWERRRGSNACPGKGDAMENELAGPSILEKMVL